MNTNPQYRERAIEQWMTQISRDGGIARFDDLHLDAIDQLWTKRKLWAEASGWAFQFGIDARVRLNLPFTFGLGMSLRPDSITPANGIRLAERIARVGWTPPSLYLFYPGQEPGSDLRGMIDAGRVEADSISASFKPIDVPAAKAGWFLRFKLSRSDEYTVSAFLLG
jgi:hypothetical protein